MIGTVRGFLYFVFGDLDGFASAVPTVGWIVGAPERVVDALGNTIESAMLIAHVLISGGLVAAVAMQVSYSVWSHVRLNLVLMAET